MKHKLILMLIGLLVITPSLVRGYNPSNEELRSSIFDYISTQSQRQQYQDILNTQNSSYQQLFNSYNQHTNNLDRELELKLKELELQRDAEERAESWEKEKQIIDQQLELIRQMNELDAQRKAFQIEKNSQDLVEYMQGVTNQITKDREAKEKSAFKNIPGSSEIDDFFSNLKTAPVVESAITTPIEAPAPRKNIFYRFWDKIINFF